MISVKESISEMESDIGFVEVETIDIVDKNNDLIFGAINTPKTKETALHIVNCCNMFPELVKALEQMVKIADNLTEYVQTITPANQIMAAKELLRQIQEDK